MNIMGGEGEFLLFGLGCLEIKCRHLLSNPVRFYKCLSEPGGGGNCAAMQLQLPGLANDVRILGIGLRLGIS